MCLKPGYHFKMQVIWFIFINRAREQQAIKIVPGV